MSPVKFIPAIVIVVFAVMSQSRSFDRQCIAQSPQDEKPEVLNQSWQSAGTIDGYGTHILSLAFGPGSVLVTSDAEFIRVWDVDTKHELPFYQPSIKNRRPMTAITYAPNDKWVSFRGVHEYHLALDRNQGMKDGLPVDSGDGTRGEKLWPLAIGSDGKTYALRSYFGEKDVVDVIQHDFEARPIKRTRPVSCRGHKDEPICAAFSPDLKLLATGSSDRTARIWDTATGKAVAILAGHDDAVSAVEFSPNGKLIATGGKDGRINLWDVATRERSLLQGKTAVRCMAFSTDGKLISSGDEEGILRIWNVEDTGIKAVLTEHKGTIFAVAFNREGSLLASAGQDKVVRLWKEKPK